MQEEVTQRTVALCVEATRLSAGMLQQAMKKYLLAALYNAPATIDSYYASLVNHDLYGSGERR